MEIRCFSLRGYIYLYCSLMRFARLTAVDASDLVYWLNTANLDSFRNTHPLAEVVESSPMTFRNCLNVEKRPYHTEIQLFKSLKTLDQNIIFESTTPAQRDAVRRGQTIMRELALSFYRVFGIDIDDPRTVYGVCADHLIPSGDEPSVCLYLDWLMLPSA